MCFKLFGVKITINFGFVLVVCLISIFSPGQEIAYCFLFIIAHEIGHGIACKVIGAGIENIKFSPFGISINIQNEYKLQACKRVAIYLAGPVVNFVLAFLLKGKIRYFNFLIGGFNLLPVSALDGGRIVEVLTGTGYLGYKIKRCIYIGISALVAIMGIYLFIVSGYNFSLIITSLYLIVEIIKKK